MMYDIITKAFWFMVTGEDDLQEVSTEDLLKLHSKSQAQVLACYLKEARGVDIH